MEFRSDEIKKVYELFVSGIQPVLEDFYTKRGKTHTTFVKAIESRYNQLQESLKSAKDVPEQVQFQREFKEGLLDLLNKHSKSYDEPYFDEFYTRFEEAVGSLLTLLDEVIEVKEPFAGYSIRLLDNPMVTIKKMTANARRQFLLQLKRGFNLIRRQFNRKACEVVVYRKRRIPLQSMARSFIMITLPVKTAHLLSTLMESQSRDIIAVWNMDEALEQEFHLKLVGETDQKETGNEDGQSPAEIFGKTIAGHKAVIKELLKEINSIGTQTFLQFDDAFGNVDTLNLPIQTYGEKRVEKGKIQRYTMYSKAMDGWKNTHKALADDWAVDVEITLLYYSVYKEFNFLQENIRAFIKNSISESFKKIKTYIITSRKGIEEGATSEETLNGKLVQERDKLAGHLVDNLLTKTIGKLAGCFSDDFAAFKKHIVTLVGQVSDNRGFIRNKNYLKGVHASDVKYISPKELLNFEAFPVFIKRVETIEIWVDTELEKTRSNLLGLGNVYDFALESALIILGNQGDTLQNAITTTVNGYNRALGHLEKAEAILSDIQQNIENDLGEAIHNFESDIQKLKNTENIYELNLKIARIKAVEHTRQYREKVKTYIKQLIPLVKELLRKAMINSAHLIESFKIRIGLTVEKKQVSFELSEFISQTQESLKQLPFVYQRLYQLNPTDEERFFVNREKEMELLHQSYENWKKNRFITVAIIGEKGSGITSLINYFLRKENTDTEVLKYTLNRKAYTAETYYDLWANLFGVETFESNEQIIDYIHSLETSRIIVIENLQHMFLKQINGFDSMNLFFELMAHTIKKALWIGAYTVHSWNYLEKTVHISNYFTNEIFVEPMNREVIKEIIYKRNRLSGFQLVFQPDSYDLHLNKYQKLDEREKQVFLQRKFFTNLRHMSAGNISLAQLYWLRLTRVATDDEITVMAIQEFDFSFVKILSSDELFTMQAMIIHDGLELADFARVMGKTEVSARNLLTPMLEKGLLIRPKQKYNINPIIFKHVANYLTSHNYVN